MRSRPSRSLQKPDQEALGLQRRTASVSEEAGLIRGKAVAKIANWRLPLDGPRQRSCQAISVSAACMTLDYSDTDSLPYSYLETYSSTGCYQTKLLLPIITQAMSILRPIKTSMHTIEFHILFLPKSPVCKFPLPRCPICISPLFQSTAVRRLVICS